MDYLFCPPEKTLEGAKRLSEVNAPAIETGLSI
jgi:hypothetical protein